jgi:hypothetical protein
VPLAYDDAGRGARVHDLGRGGPVPVMVANLIDFVVGQAAHMALGRDFEFPQ